MLTPNKNPNAAGEKRKRGRPTGAPKPSPDASNREPQVDNDADDAEDESRPKKRGRKTQNMTKDQASIPEAQSDPVGKRGRPPKQQEPKQGNTTENALKQKRLASKPALKPEETSKSTKGKKNPASVADETTKPEPRRSGRDRRNPTEVDRAERTDVSKDESNASTSRQRRSKRSPVSELSNSNSKRSSRERNARDPAQASSSATRSGVEETGATQVANKKKSNKQIKHGQEEATVTERGGPTVQNAESKKRRQRPPSTVQDEPQENPPRPRKSKEKGKSTTQISAAEDMENDAPKRRARPKVSVQATQESSQGGGSESRAPRRERSSSVARTKEPPPKSRQKEANVEVESSGSSDEEPDLPFRQLKETQLKIARSTVRSKWSRLDGPSINIINSLLSDAQRPALFRLQNTNRRREHASAAMGVASRKVRAKLIQGFPFPAPIVAASSRANPRSYEDEFDFERTVDNLQNLENTLNPLLHSVDLLEKEIKKQEDALAKDYHSLHRLENNARLKTNEWREKAKREHALAPGVKRTDSSHHREFYDQLELVPSAEDSVFKAFATVCEDHRFSILIRNQALIIIQSCRVRKTRNWSCSRGRSGAIWKA